MGSKRKEENLMPFQETKGVECFGNDSQWAFQGGFGNEVLGCVLGGRQFRNCVRSGPGWR